MKRTRIALVATVAVAALLPLSPAKACSCAYPYDARDRLAEADGAFIGTLLSSAPDPEDQYGVVMTFEVEEGVKGDLGETVEIHTADNGAACGIEASPGSTYGYFLRRYEDTWHSGLCDGIHPDELRAAAAPLPEPDGAGPPRFIVGGSFGDQRSIALDFRTRTLGYAAGDGDVTMMEVCPRSDLVAELVAGSTHARTVAVRSTTGLVVERTWQAPRRRSFWHQALGCHNRSARGISIFGIDQTSRKLDARIWQRDGGRWKVIYRGPASEAVFGRRAAYVVEHRRSLVLVKIRLSDGKRSRISELPGDLAFGLSLGAAERFLALGTGPRYEDRREEASHLHVVRLRNGATSSRGLGRGGPWGSTAWAGDFRIVFFCESGACRSSVFNRRVQRIGTFDRWPARGGAVTRRFAYGVFFGRLISVRLPDGPIVVQQELPSPVTNALVRLPK